MRSRKEAIMLAIVEKMHRPRRMAFWREEEEEKGKVNESLSVVVQ